jgi:hypothetical protein
MKGVDFTNLCLALYDDSVNFTAYEALDVGYAAIGVPLNMCTIAYSNIEIPCSLKSHWIWISLAHVSQ